MQRQKNVNKLNIFENNLMSYLSLVFNLNNMVILKVGTENDPEKQVEIVSERGVWGSGAYRIFAAKFINKFSHKDLPVEPSDTNDPNFLGEINIDKEKEKWEYKGTKLKIPELKKIVDFIFDYNAPDAVY